MKRLTAVLIAAALSLVVLSAGAGAKLPSCGEAWATVEGGTPSPYIIARDGGQTLRLGVDSALTVRAASPPPGAELEAFITAWGFDLRRNLGPLAAGELTLDTKEYAKYLPGQSTVVLVQRVNGEEVCMDRLSVTVDGFGGPIALAVAAVTVVAGITSLGSVTVLARGGIEVSADVQTKRRKRHGWRRVVPVLHWKGMAIGALFGAVTGFAGAYVLQGIGAVVVDLPKAFIAAVAGGAFTIGAGLGLASVLTFLRSAKDNEDED